ncbi:cupin domain-containing protein [Phycisphaera mikurensis]|uniref:Cupin type-2 domain-containing protein n=1 Tax=Phycisphaera mikurensis (strain NBRC 102666 / KCTC 22515 / FYK2301M01) TaxID=1142394 RepID=I0IDZ1_PHYMF|nr:cupin domain-containing protein [Phycisphaera mikurensis]MBB6441286.1 quercetin dioxygenase-like cupin family protein [Phycisphaera mikurensis]BAM03479.1 hypothetical protein PSMK_13200 [Phycisphaera mikurensis NBRC 102666]
MEHSTHRNDAPTGDRGQKQLIEGDGALLRLWQDAQPGQHSEMHTTPYETLGYVISGRGICHLGDEAIPLGPGTAWRVPKDTPHRYEITEALTAVESITPRP